MNNFSFEPLKLKLVTNNIIIPMENGVADLTNAETSAKIMLAGKELFPIFDESIGGRNYVQNSKYREKPIGTAIITLVPAGIYLDPNDTYTISFDYEYLDELSKPSHMLLYRGGHIASIPIIDFPKGKRIYTFKHSNIGNTNSNIYIYGDSLSSTSTNRHVIYQNIKIEKGNNPNPVWTPAPEEVLQLATLTFYNCSAAIVDDLVKITSHKPGTTRGWVDVTVNYGNLSNTKRLNWSVEGVEPYKPTGTLLTMNNRGIKL